MAPSRTDEAAHAVTNCDSGNENQENSHQTSGEDNPKNNYDSKDESSPGKIFIGGLSRETTTDTFTKYFSKYGELTDSVIMRDRITGNPRGFGFVTYADPSVVDKVIKDKHVIDGKLVEIKRTIPRGNVPSKGPKTKKIFVGGIPTTMTEDEFRDHFSRYGKVVEHQIMLDHSTGRSRGFGFITFDSEISVEEILSQGRMHDLGGKKVEIKKAEPKKPLPDSEPAYGMDSRPPYHSGGRGGYGELYGGLGAGGYSSSYRTGAYSGRPGGYGTYGGPDYGSSYGGYGSGSLGSYRGDSGGYGSRYGPYSGGYGGYGSGMVGGYGDSDSFVGGYAGSSYASGYDSGLGSGYGSSAGFGSRGYGGGSSGRYHPYAR